MQIEDVLKFAINSTVGTDDFKPLDQIITDGKGLVASDNLYYQLNSARHGSDSATVTINTATMHCNGSMRAKGTATMYGAYAVIRLRVYKNGAEYASQYWNNRGASEAGVEKSLDISFIRGDVLRFDVAFEDIGSSGELSNIKLCADVVDLSGITVS